MSDGNAVADDGAAGCVIRLTGPLAGEGINRGLLNVFQYCCSGVNRVDGSAGSLTCCRGRTGAAIFPASKTAQRQSQPENKRSSVASFLLAALVLLPRLLVRS